MNQERVVLYNNAKEDVPNSKFRHLEKDNDRLYITRVNVVKQTQNHPTKTQLVRMSIEKAKTKFPEEMWEYLAYMKLEDNMVDSIRDIKNVNWTLYPYEVPKY